jgi:hypothetical protein
MAEGIQAGIPSEEAVREALGHLCTKGVVPWWVQDRADVLLGLTCVSARVESGGGSIDRVEALTEILRELVGRIYHQSHGKILWIVLALDEQYVGLSAEERRQLAGREFRGGAEPVSAGTIRQLHEKRALDRLTTLLIEYERRNLSGSQALSSTASRLGSSTAG